MGVTRRCYGPTSQDDLRRRTFFRISVWNQSCPFRIDDKHVSLIPDSLFERIHAACVWVRNVRVPFANKSCLVYHVMPDLQVS